MSKIKTIKENDETHLLMPYEDADEIIEKLKGTVSNLHNIYVAKKDLEEESVEEI